MKKINPNKILFIKLGENGRYEKDCIEISQTIKIDYRKISHDLCINNKWNEVYKFFIETENTMNYVATNHTNQIKQFYTEDENTLWITFYANKLWWCFSEPEIIYQPDKSKIRHVIGKWSDKDINGKILTFENISGSLLKTQGFRGTICKVPEEKYALKKINAEQTQDIIDVENALTNLTEKLTHLINQLHWEDFETLIDLIFRQAGWQRVSPLGKTQKSFDLDLFAPVTGEKALVQVKSQSDIKEFEKFQKDFANMSEYHKCFYIVHSPKNNLLEFENDPEINIYFNKKISELAINAGLTDWIIKKLI